MNKRLITLSIGVALLYVAAGKAEGVDQRCRVASLILRSALSDKVGNSVILANKVQASPIADEGGRWLSPKGSKIKAPPSALIHKLKSTNVVSAVGHCSFVSDLAGKKVQIGPSAVNKAMADFSQKSDGRNSVIIALSVPVISSDGRSALAYYNEVSGLTAGGTYTFYLKKDKNGQWIIVGSLVGTVA